MNQLETPWINWKMKDKITLILLAVFLALSLCMGAGNVYANLMAMGNPALIANPWLAVMLSTLMPTGSLAIKFVTNFIHHDPTRKGYAISIYIFTAIALVSWILLLGQEAGGSFDFDALIANVANGDIGSHGFGSLLIQVQLLAELLTGGALALALEDIYLSYCINRYIDNPKYTFIEKTIEAHLVKHAAICKQRADLHEKRAQLIAARQVFIDLLIDVLTLKENP